ncbi:hypothetical protein FB451DRAFT_1182794 [Mycena latifolia]|nr:hypothetical protein FB451DRAFT_1182794 [Mycena latifolia]
MRLARAVILDEPSGTSGREATLDIGGKPWATQRKMNFHQRGEGAILTPLCAHMESTMPAIKMPSTSSLSSSRVNGRANGGTGCRGSYVKARKNASCVQESGSAWGDNSAFSIIRSSRLGKANVGKECVWDLFVVSTPPNSPVASRIVTKNPGTSLRSRGICRFNRVNCGHGNNADRDTNDWEPRDIQARAHSHVKGGEEWERVSLAKQVCSEFGPDVETKMLQSFVLSEHKGRVVDLASTRLALEIEMIPQSGAALANLTPTRKISARISDEIRPGYGVWAKEICRGGPWEAPLFFEFQKCEKCLRDLTVERRQGRESIIKRELDTKSLGIEYEYDTLQIFGQHYYE